jgi:hypothetical protein
MVTMKITVFWVAKQWQLFTDVSEESVSSIFRVEHEDRDRSFPQISANICRTTLRHIPEDSNFHVARVCSIYNV